jgi:hypothetical protein
MDEETGMEPSINENNMKEYLREVIEELKRTR